MQALAAGGLAEAFESERSQALTHLTRSIDHSGECNIGRRIKVEHQPSRHIGFVRRAIPGMKFESADLRDSDQTFDAVDLHIGLAVAGDFHDIDQVRHTGHGMALKEGLAADSIGRADDRAGAASDMFDQPVADLLHVMGEIELGHRFAVAAIGPHRLAGL